MHRQVGDAIILAAGFGARMRPLTDRRAKPLLPVTGVPSLEIAAARLLREGAQRLHINLHHHGAQVRAFAGEKGWPAVFHEERPILDTGGGIGNMAPSLSTDGPILLHNGDVVASIRYDGALDFHRDRGALLTMILLRSGEPERAPPAAVSVDAGGEVTGIGASTGGVPPAFGYTGLAVIEPAALEYFPRSRPEGLVSIVLRMMRERPGSVAGFDASAGGARPQWGEIGTPRSYLEIPRRILVGKASFDPLIPPPPLALRVGEGATVDPGAIWRGFLDAGAGAVIERDTELEDCVVLDGSAVRAGARLRGAIVFPGGVLEAV
ncbi:MAG: sugar phosphate nucleotidyltransferase [Candidatus Krumholzibacteria bacterium]|nr:sugar phosphate nucleotidyltransferase [Candidatus Krumholzibacteria bacterium]